MLFQLSGHTNWILSLAVMSNGWLASGSFDSNINIWDLEQRRLIKTLRGHTSVVTSLKALSNGNLVSCSNDDSIKVWNPLLNDQPPLLMTIQGHKTLDFPLDM